MKIFTLKLKEIEDDSRGDLFDKLIQWKALEFDESKKVYKLYSYDSCGVARSHVANIRKLSRVYYSYEYVLRKVAAYYLSLDAPFSEEWFSGLQEISSHSFSANIVMRAQNYIDEDPKIREMIKRGISIEEECQARDLWYYYIGSLNRLFNFSRLE